MKKYILILGLCATSVMYSSCKKSSFDELYRDPSKVTEATVERQFTGMIYSYRQLMVPDYRNIFVTLRPTLFRYMHVTGWINESNHLLPGAAAIEDRWTRYYEGLAQYKELENIYNKSIDVEKEEKKIFFLAAQMLFFDQTQQTVDLHGDIPWSQAGLLSSNNSDYQASYPAYDKAEDIYTAMLDRLKVISTELNSISLSSSIQEKFNTHDLVNGGKLDLWKKYCNSLRLRMLTRVSESPAFSARASQEIAEIVSDPSTYPLITTNSENAQIDIFNLDDNNINTKGIRDAFEADGWAANVASGEMIDHMIENADPRMPFIFELGPVANGQFRGLDQSLNSTAQSELIRGGTLSLINRSTISRNQFLPGILFSATETHMLLAEHYLKTGNAGAARSAFEDGIEESVALYRAIRAVSNDNTVPAAPAPTQNQINTYLSNLDWNGTSNKLNLIAEQKWIHFNVLQTVHAWSEARRLDYPSFEFQVQNSDIQKTVPVKFNLPPSESVYNAANYEAVKAQDDVNMRLFWDVD